VQAEGQHRDHAVVEQVFADVTSGPLAHMPSGVFAANAAWLSMAAMAHNLVRAAGALASLSFAKARAATIRRDLIAVAARTARHGGRTPSPRITSRNSSCRNQAGNELPELAGGSRLSIRNDALTSSRSGV
jgi:hypothetical protein